MLRVVTNGQTLTGAAARRVIATEAAERYAADLASAHKCGACGWTVGGRRGWDHHPTCPNGGADNGR